MTSSSPTALTSSASPTNTITESISINESGLEMTPSREKPSSPSLPPTQTRNQSNNVKTENEISSRIDRILNSTVDEFDKIEICQAPSVTKTSRRSPSPSLSLKP